MIASVPLWFYGAAFGLLGLVFGSFANVVIWRFPRGESLSHPGSRCPGCQTPIVWRDNVPVISWLLLRGRCRTCDEPISVRYPVVELLSGCLWLLAFLVFGLTPRFAFAVAFVYLLLILSFIDLDTMRLPNPIVGTLAAIGAAGVAVAQFSGLDVVPLVNGGGALAQPVLFALVGVGLGGGVPLLISLAYASIRGGAGIGMGDIKLLSVFGLFLGPYAVLALFFGSIAGALGSVFLGGDGGARRKIPFGPFLAIGAVVTAAVGPQIWSWYLSIL